MSPGSRCRRTGRCIVLVAVLVAAAVSCGSDDGTSSDVSGSSTLGLPPSTTTVLDEGWVERDVTFAFGEDRLHGVLTLPTADGVHPAIVLLSGSAGPTGGRAGVSVDTFVDHSRRLASTGFAVLRYDPPGVGRSSGEIDLPSLQRRTDEAAAAVTYLQTEPVVADDEIGLLGVSQGGWVTAMTAARYPEDVAFLVSVVGSGQSVARQQVYGIEAQSRAAGLDEDDVARAVLFGRLLIDLQLSEPMFRTINEADAVALGVGPWTELLALVYDTTVADPVETLLAATEIMRSVQDEPWAAALHLGDRYIPQLERIPPDISHEQLAGIRAGIEESLSVDPEDFLTDVHVPVLAFFGELDVTVDTAVSAALYEEYLARAGNEDVTIVIIPGVGHDITTRTPGYWETLSGWLTSRHGN